MGPYVIAVANRKGGTGKTTTSLHLAAGLARQGHRVLLVDLDRQGHCAHALGLKMSRDHPAVHDLPRDGPSALHAALLKTGVERLDLAPAATGMGRTEGEIPPGVLRDALRTDAIQARYDLVVIDTAPAFDPDMVMALAAANGVVIPFLPHPLSLEGIRQFSRIFLMVRMKINPSIREFGLVACQYNQQSLVHRGILQTVEREFGADKLIGTIRADIRIAEAVERGVTVDRHAPASRGAADYGRLIDTVDADWLSAHAARMDQKRTAARSS